MEPEELYRLRHSLSHVVAMAVLEMFPDAKLAIGPPIDNGFYYDFDLPRSLQPEDLKDVQRRMNKIVHQRVQFIASKVSIKEATKLFANQPYKLELIRDLEKTGETELGLYTSGSFSDLCKGLHLSSTSEVPDGCFELSHVAGAYWRGDEKRPMLQRIYGLAFESEKALKEYKAMAEEAKRRDHRVLGPQLGIFMHSEDVGAGLPLWLPNGETIKHLLMQYMREKEEALGYKYVSTPVLANENLYKRSGHAQYYADDMYSFLDKEGARFYMKPMNCPHHHMIFEKLVTSYRDLPLKLAESGDLYRNELSGTLAGLIRVRGAINQNDSHIYVTPAQLKEEFIKVLDLFKEVYADMGITGYWFRLSLPDFEKGKFGGDQEKWEQASEVIRECLQEFGTPFVEATGEAAFYGPKLDVQIKNVTGKEDTIATSQVDILVPQRMDITYVDEQGTKQYPIVIHRAILGSYQRFIAFLIEQTAGNFPFWLAPIQVSVLAVSDQFNEAAGEVAKTLQQAGIRVNLDISSESVGKKIRLASLQKIPAKLVIGQKEVDAKANNGEWAMSVNWRSDLGEGRSEENFKLSDLIDLFSVLASAKSK